MAGVVMDITERKKADKELQRLTQELAASNEEIQSSLEELSQTNKELVKINADLDNFIYTASHDLKAPISNIEGLVDAMARHLTHRKLDISALTKLISLIQTSVERFKKTIRELTDIAQVQKEVQEVSLINPADVIREVQTELQSLIQITKAKINLQIKNAPPLEFSYKNLKSIVYNLLSNAIKYRAPDRQLHIVISCYREPECLVLTVQDNGLGISELGKDKIFLMFKRLHAHVEGSGVGLYLVKRIVDNAGGKLQVDSQEGKGSTFKIYLPLNEAYLS